MFGILLSQMPIYTTLSSVTFNYITNCQRNSKKPMASSSNPRNASSFTSNGSSSDSDDPMMNETESYTDYQHIEKSLTNLNANLASIAEQIEGLSISHKEFCFTLKEQQKLFIEGFNQNHEEFCLNFIQQQKLLLEETVKIRVEASKIRERIN